MKRALEANDRLCILIVTVLLWMALQVNAYRLGLPRAVRRWRGSVRKLVDRWLHLSGQEQEPKRFFRRASNRTPEYIEEMVARLHVEQPQLGAGQLRFLLERLTGWRMVRETVRKILLRRKDLIVQMQLAKKKYPRRITVKRPLSLWGADITMVWVLGFIPIWVLGIVDYHGSRLMALERLRWPTSAEVQRVFQKAFAEHGVPKRVLTDNGGQFTSIEFELMLCVYNVDHTLTRPAHPWTNGRIERLFRTFKETIFYSRWLISSKTQLDRFLAEFAQFYNRDRPHSAFSGRTPDEVFFKKLRSPRRQHDRVTYFDGALNWYRFG
jgi:transposase InsO family protein